MRFLNYLNFHLDNRKCSALEAGITAAATTSAALASSASQAKSNHAGRALARWQTHQNINLAHEQMAANRKMFEDSIAEQRLAEERANEWNKASAVAQRFRDAGINPYLAMMEGAAGQMAGQSDTSSTPSGSQGTSGSVAVSPSYPPVYDIGRGINDAVSTFFQSLKTTSDVANEKVLTQMQVAKAQAEIEDLHKRGLLTDAERASYENSLKEARETFKFRTRGLELSNDKLSSEIAVNQADAALKSMQKDLAASNIRLNDWQVERGKKLLKYEISDLIASVNQRNAAAVESRAAASHYASEDKYKWAMFDTELRNRKADIKLKLAQALGIQSKDKREQSDFDNWWKHYVEPILGDAIQAAGIGLGIYTGARSAGAVGASSVPPMSIQRTNPTLYVP